MSFVVLAELGELDEAPLAVEVPDSDLELALIRIGDEVFAIHDECTHGKVRLSEGDVDPQACAIECALHGAAFDLRTGEVLNPPATRPINVYPCLITDGQVLVDIDNPITQEEK